MAILNYTTEVPAEKTIGEITGLLVRKGARTVSSEYNPDSTVAAVTFVMLVGGMPVRFQLPANTDGVLSAMLKEKPFNERHHGRGNGPKYTARMRAQAERVSWRILKDWIEAQLALIESGQAEMGQVFMPYGLNEQGTTMYELFLGSNQKRLGSGK